MKKRTDRRRWPLVLLVLLVVGALAVLAVKEEAPEQEGRPEEKVEEPGKPVPQPSPEPAPQPAPEPVLTLAEQLLGEMSLREKVCQMMMVFPGDITGVDRTVVAGETTRKALETYPVGGFLCDRRNLVSQEQITRMLTTVQTYSRIPLLLSCDEEGGRVNRLMSTVGTTYVGPMLDYESQGAARAEENAAVIAKDLKACGFNMDLAPVADVWSNPQNTVIGDRAYSDSFQTAAELIPGAVKGFHQGGVACTLKHFPGHGDTSEDTHYGSAYVRKSLESLRSAELLPFQAGIDAGADAVMMGHLILPQIEEVPAPFSHRLVTEILREEMGFQGVVMTDGLRMQAMTDHYGSGEIAVRAVKAGVDLLLCPADLDAAIQALMDAVEQGEIPEERLDESVLRLLTLKEQLGLLEGRI